MRLCKHCENEIPSFRRVDAVFCSPVCRNAFWQQNNRKKGSLNNTLGDAEKCFKKATQSVVIMEN